MARVNSLLLLTLLSLSPPVLAAPPSGLERGMPENLGFSSQRLALAHKMLLQHVEDGRVAGLVAVHLPTKQGMSKVPGLAVLFPLALAAVGLKMRPNHNIFKQMRRPGLARSQ